MADLKRAVRNWLPPAITGWIQNKRRHDSYFEGEFPTWEEARSKCSGYDSDDILLRVLAATLNVKRGGAAYERDSVLFDRAEYEWPVVAGLLRTASLNGGRLSVLDFGGALGSSYFQHRALLENLPEMRWSVVEQAHYVRAGQEQIQDRILRFYSSIEDCAADSKPNAIILSSVVQYLEAPENILSELLICGADTVILDRTIVNTSSGHRIYVQHVPASIYPASYPCRSLSESKLLAEFGPRYRLVSDFPTLTFPALDSIQSEFKGFLFERYRG